MIIIGGVFLSLPRMLFSATKPSGNGGKCGRLLWLGFALATVLLLVAVIVPAIHPRPSEETLRIAEIIERAGGNVAIPFGEVVGVRYENTQVCDDDLIHLEGLPELLALNLRGTVVGNRGLRHVAPISSLKYLYLDGTRVTDDGLAFLEGLTNLRTLTLEHTEVSDRGLEHLVGLKNLEVLRLAGTQVTAEGVRKLQARLPRLETAPEYAPAKPPGLP